MIIPQTQKRKFIIDCTIEYPENGFNAEMLAKIIQDYIHLCRFVVIGQTNIIVYPTNVKIIQNPITLVSGMQDIKN